MNRQEEKLNSPKTWYMKPSIEVLELELEAVLLAVSSDKSASFGGNPAGSYNGGQGNHLNVTRR